MIKITISIILLFLGFQFGFSQTDSTGNPLPQDSIPIVPSFIDYNYFISPDSLFIKSAGDINSVLPIGYENLENPADVSLNHEYNLNSNYFITAGVSTLMGKYIKI